MDDKRAMRKLYGGANRKKQPQPLAQGQTGGVAIEIERLALDVFHHQIGRSGRGHSSVKKTRDVGMIEIGEDLAFRAEPLQHFHAGYLRPDQLNGDVFPVLPVAAEAGIDLPHTAAPDRPFDGVCTHLIARVEARPVTEQSAFFVDCAGEAGIRRKIEQPLYFGTKIGLVRAGFVEKGRGCLRRKFGRRVKQFLDPFPTREIGREGIRGEALHFVMLTSGQMGEEGEGCEESSVQGSTEQLLPLVYNELRRLAARHLQSERSGHTLAPTALVHEAYLRLASADNRWADRKHFFAVAATVMRRILVDHAKERHRQKRGGHAEKVPLEDSMNVSVATDPRILQLDAALNELFRMDPGKGRIIELLFFGGLTFAEIAEVTGVPDAKLRREVKFAKLWIQGQMSD
jgi:RNA polymerase sigma-70 factor (ECF subfamily)